MADDDEEYVVSVYDDNDPRIIENPRLKLSPDKQQRLIANTNHKASTGKCAPVILNHGVSDNADGSISIPTPDQIDIYRAGNVKQAWKDGNRILMKFTVEPSKYKESGMGAISKTLIDDHHLLHASLRHNDSTGEIEELSVVEKGARKGCIIIPWKEYQSNGYNPITSYQRQGISVMASASSQQQDTKVSSSSPLPSAQSSPSTTTTTSSSSSSSSQQQQNNNNTTSTPTKPTGLLKTELADQQPVNGKYQVSEKSLLDIAKGLQEREQQVDSLEAKLAAAYEDKKKLEQQMKEEHERNMKQSGVLMSLLQSQKRKPNQALRNLKEQYENNHSILAANELAFVVEGLIDNVNAGHERAETAQLSVPNQIDRLLGRISGGSSGSGTKRNRSYDTDDDTNDTTKRAVTDQKQSSSSSSVLASGNLKSSSSSSSSDTPYYPPNVVPGLSSVSQELMMLMRF